MSRAAALNDIDQNIDEIDSMFYLFGSFTFVLFIIVFTKLLKAIGS